MTEYCYDKSYVIGEQVIESFKLGYPPIASKAVGLAMYRKKFLVMTEYYYDKSYVIG